MPLASVINFLTKSIHQFAKSTKINEKKFDSTFANEKKKTFANASLTLKTGKHLARNFDLHCQLIFRKDTFTMFTMFTMFTN